MYWADRGKWEDQNRALHLTDRLVHMQQIAVVFHSQPKIRHKHKIWPQRENSKWSEQNWGRSVWKQGLDLLLEEHNSQQTQTQPCAEKRWRILPNVSFPPGATALDREAFAPQEAAKHFHHSGFWHIWSSCSSKLKHLSLYRFIFSIILKLRPIGCERKLTAYILSCKVPNINYTIFLPLSVVQFHSPAVRESLVKSDMCRANMILPVILVMLRYQRALGRKGWHQNPITGSNGRIGATRSSPKSLSDLFWSTRLIFKTLGPLNVADKLQNRLYVNV